MSIFHTIKYPIPDNHYDDFLEAWLALPNSLRTYLSQKLKNQPQRLFSKDHIADIRKYILEYEGDEL